MDESARGKIDILITGVGGQGVVLAGDIIGDVALETGYDVKKSDTQGMAQRGGSVVAHVRLGTDVASPLIPKGEADYLLSFEKLETMRWVDHIKDGAIVIFNEQAIPPLSVSRGEAEYPDDEKIFSTIGARTEDFFPLQGDKLVDGLGEPKVLNMLMLGALSMFLPFSPDVWRKVIAQRLPEKAAALNVKAFDAGRKELLRQTAEKARQEELFELEEGDHQHEDDCGCE